MLMSLDLYHLLIHLFQTRSYHDLAKAAEAARTMVVKAHKLEIFDAILRVRYKRDQFERRVIGKYPNLTNIDLS